MTTNKSNQKLPKINDKANEKIVKDDSQKRKTFQERYRDNFFTWTISLILFLVFLLAIFFLFKTDKQLPGDLADVKTKIEQTVQSRKNNNLLSPEVDNTISEAAANLINKLNPNDRVKENKDNLNSLKCNVIGNKILCEKLDGTTPKKEEVVSLFN